MVLLNIYVVANNGIKTTRHTHVIEKDKFGRLHFFSEVRQIVFANQHEFLLSLLGTCKKPENLSTEKMVYFHKKGNFKMNLLPS